MATHEITVVVLARSTARVTSEEEEAAIEAEVTSVRVPKRLFSLHSEVLASIIEDGTEELHLPNTTIGTLNEVLQWMDINSLAFAQQEFKDFLNKSQRYTDPSRAELVLVKYESYKNILEFCLQYDCQSLLNAFYLALNNIPAASITDLAAALVLLLDKQLTPDLNWASCIIAQLAKVYLARQWDVSFKESGESARISNALDGNSSLAVRFQTDFRSRHPEDLLKLRKQTLLQLHAYIAGVPTEWVKGNGKRCLAVLSKMLLEKILPTSSI